LRKIEIQFPLNNLSFLWQSDARHGMYIAYIKRQLGIATQIAVIKVKVTVAKIENNDTACECNLDIWEQGQGHLLTIDIQSSTQ